MEKWFKKCPFCANEISEDAIKCQYCQEFINGTYPKGKEELNNNQSNPRYKNIWLWISVWVIAFVIIWIIALYNSDMWKKIRTGYILEKADKYIQETKSFEEIKDEMSWIEAKSEEEEAALNELLWLIDDLWTKVESIEWELALNTTDYNNAQLVEQWINAWKLYKQYFEEYYKNISAIFSKYKNLDNTWTGRYSLTWLTKQIKKLSDSLTIMADKMIEFYSYILTVQDDFYVDDNWDVLFYNDWKELKEYNRIYIELQEISIKFLEDYNAYWDYMKGYNNYHGL